MYKLSPQYAQTNLIPSKAIKAACGIVYHMQFERLRKKFGISPTSLIKGRTKYYSRSDAEKFLKLYQELDTKPKSTAITDDKLDKLLTIQAQHTMEIARLDNEKWGQEEVNNHYKDLLSFKDTATKLIKKLVADVKELQGKNNS